MLQPVRTCFRDLSPVDLLYNRTLHLVVFNLLIVGFFGMMAPSFLQSGNFLYIFKYAGILGLLGFAQALVMLAGNGGIDLSVGSMLSLVAVVHFYLTGVVNVWVAALLVLPLGMILGAFNGFLTTGMRMPPFMATLATLYAYSGLALGITGGVPLSGFPRHFSLLGQGDIFQVPIQFLVLLVAYLPLAFVLGRTDVGRHIYAIGDNENAASLVGISPRRIRFSLYVVNGFISALCAVMMNSWLLTARPDAGSGYELRAIAIAVLGGVDIFGGSGRLSGVLLATMAIVLIEGGMQQLNISPVWQLGVVGLLLVLVTAFNQLVRHARSR